MIRELTAVMRGLAPLSWHLQPSIKGLQLGRTVSLQLCSVLHRSLEQVFDPVAAVLQAPSHSSTLLQRKYTIVCAGSLQERC